MIAGLVGFGFATFAISWAWGFGWGYGHIVQFGGVAAVGAVLRAAASYIDHHSVLAATGTLLTVAVAMAVYIAAIYCMSRRAHSLVRPLPRLPGRRVRRHRRGFRADGHRRRAPGLVPARPVPGAVGEVVGYETIGHRHSEQVLARVRGGVAAH